MANHGTLFAIKAVLCNDTKSRSFMNTKDIFYAARSTIRLDGVVALRLSERGMKFIARPEGIRGDCLFCGQGCSPFSTNSLTRVWQCEACGRQGDVIDFIRFDEQPKNRRQLKSILREIYRVLV